MNARAWAAARNLATTLRTVYAEQVTGRRWFRSTQTCPIWCAADHRCTARHGYSGGEHRSEPVTWRTDYGTLIATRVETLNRAAHVELRLTARLDRDDAVATHQARLLTAGVDLVASAVLAAAAGIANTGRTAVSA